MASYRKDEEEPYFFVGHEPPRPAGGLRAMSPPGAYQPHDPTPNAVGGANGVRVGIWDSQLCGCCENVVPNCLMATFCPCVTIAQTSARLGLLPFGVAITLFLLLVLAEYIPFGIVVYRIATVTGSEEYLCTYDYYGYDCYYGSESFGSTYAILCVVAILCSIVVSLYIWRLRSVTRTRFQLPGSGCGDFWMAFCCGCCSIAQVATHIKSYTPGSCAFGPVDTLPAYSAQGATTTAAVPARTNQPQSRPDPRLDAHGQRHQHAIDIQAQRRAYNTPPTAQSTISRPSTTHSRSIPTGKSSSSSASRPSTTSSTGAGLWEDPVIVAARIPFSNVQLIERLSQGGNGEVYRGVYRDRAVAVKMLLYANRKDMKHINAFLSEIKLAATLDHPNIVQFVGVAWESLSELYSVAEFADGGDLRTLLTHYKDQGYPRGIDSTKLRIAMEVAHALTYMHSLEQPVLHRDLKSRNILLTAQLQAKVTDFGASQIRMDRTLTAGVGTCLWMAPEVVMGERYDEKADVFSFGAVLSELDTNELPYEDARQREGDEMLPDMAVMQLVLMGKLRLEFSSNMHPELLRLAHDCIETDPKRRPTAAEAAYRLSKVLKAVS